MSFTMDPNLEARLREIAQKQGRDVQSVVTDALRSFAETATRDNGAKQPGGAPSVGRHPLRGSVLQYDAPCKPAIPDSDWESTR